MSARVAGPLALSLILSAAAGARVVIGPTAAAIPASILPDQPRWVDNRPVDGRTLDLNPPRFSWTWLPDGPPYDGALPGDVAFSLQIASDEAFTQPVVDVPETRSNCYNFLPPLPSTGPWYWRVGYRVEGKERAWGKTRSFTLSPDAVVWDRSEIPALLANLHGHPRILLPPGGRDALVAIRDRKPDAAELAEYLIAVADKVIGSKNYREFPVDDSRKTNGSWFLSLGRDLVFVAFAKLLTGDAQYDGFRERVVTMASWPKGGYSSPEGAGSIDKWATHLTEYLGLIYDTFYDDFTAAERATLRGSIAWRLEHTLKSFAMWRNDGQITRQGCLSVMASSHPYENLMVSLPGAVAIADESPIGREFLELGLNYLIGITNGFGEDEGWNEGAGYGNGKMKWLMDATGYLTAAMPELQLGRNPVYADLADFFARITPLGARHTSFGNRGHNELDWTGSRITTMRRVAQLTGSRQAMANWLASRERLTELKGAEPQPYSPWLDYVLAGRFDVPEPAVEDDDCKVFPLAGWVTVSSAPPSALEAQRDAVSMTFQCRPQGGFSHAFRSENAFDIHAYGETVTVGGGTTSNQSFYANHTMSHNTLLINGQEQLGSKSSNAGVKGRIAAYQEGDGYVYFAGDATGAYGPETHLKKFVRHVLFVDQAWFAIYDELELDDAAEPGTFQWLYHLTPEVGLRFDAAHFRFDYQVGATRVAMQQFLGTDDLTFSDRAGITGMINPITGEDLTTMDKWVRADETPKDLAALSAHHLWITRRTPAKQARFLAVIVPYKDGEWAPTIEPLGDAGAMVEFRGVRRSVAFNAKLPADVVVDLDRTGVPLPPPTPGPTTP